MKVYILRANDNRIINTFDNLDAAIDSICKSLGTDSCQLTMSAGFSYNDDNIFMRRCSVVIGGVFVGNIWICNVLTHSKKEVMG
jgi:hypothetical protein